MRRTTRRLVVPPLVVPLLVGPPLVVVSTLQAQSGQTIEGGALVDHDHGFVWRLPDAGWLRTTTDEWELHPERAAAELWPGAIAMMRRGDVTALVYAFEDCGDAKQTIERACQLLPFPGLAPVWIERGVDPALAMSATSAGDIVYGIEIRARVRRGRGYAVVSLDRDRVGRARRTAAAIESLRLIDDVFPGRPPPGHLPIATGDGWLRAPDRFVSTVAGSTIATDAALDVVAGPDAGFLSGQCEAIALRRDGRLQMAVGTVPVRGGAPVLEADMFSDRIPGDAPMSQLTVLGAKRSFRTWTEASFRFHHARFVADGARWLVTLRHPTADPDAVRLAPDLLRRVGSLPKTERDRLLAVATGRGRPLGGDAVWRAGTYVSGRDGLALTVPPPTIARPCSAGRMLLPEFGLSVRPSRSTTLREAPSHRPWGKRHAPDLEDGWTIRETTTETGRLCHIAEIRHLGTISVDTIHLAFVGRAVGLESGNEVVTAILDSVEAGIAYPGKTRHGLLVARPHDWIDARAGFAIHAGDGAFIDAADTHPFRTLRRDDEVLVVGRDRARLGTVLVRPRRLGPAGWREYLERLVAEHFRTTGDDWDWHDASLDGFPARTALAESPNGDAFEIHTLHRGEFGFVIARRRGGDGRQLPEWTFELLDAPRLLK